MAPKSATVACAGSSGGGAAGMWPDPPKSWSVAVSDGKAASTRFVEVARFADAPATLLRNARKYGTISPY